MKSQNVQSFSLGACTNAPLHDELAKVTEHGRGLLDRGPGNPKPLSTSLVTGKVVDAGSNARTFVHAPQQLDCRQAIERMLKTTTAVERAYPVVAPVAAGLVVEHLERSGPHLIDPVDAARNPECQSRAKVDIDRLHTGQRFQIVR